MLAWVRCASNSPQPGASPSRRSLRFCTTLLGLVLLAPAARAAARPAPGVDGPSGGKLSATVLGPLTPGARARLAVKWTGEPGERLTVWYDADGDGEFRDSEVVLPNAILEKPIQVLEFEVPSWASSATGKIRLQTSDAVEASLPGSSSSGTCQFATGFEAPGINGDLLAAVVYDDGTGPALYVGGLFTEAGTASASRIAKWDGTTWSALGSSGNGVNAEVRALAVYDDGSGPALFVGGNFTTAGGISANRIAKWDGTSWSALGSPTNGVNAPAHAFAVYDDGSGLALYVGGTFTTAGGVSASRIAKWDGTSWSALGSPTNGTDGGVLALATYDDGSGPALYAGGGFGTAGGNATSNIAKWDGTSWSPLGSPTNGVDNYVNALAVFDDGSGSALYAGGLFTSAGGISANRIAKWDGSSWSVLGSPTNGLNNEVVSLGVFDDGGGPALYVGGFFNAAGGSAASRIAKWNGTSWSALGSPTNGTSSWVRAMVGYDDGSGAELYAVGAFISAGGVPAQRIAKWNGARWASLGNGVNGTFTYVSALTVFDNGAGPALYAGGGFIGAGGTSANNVAKWNGAAWSALGGGLNDEVYSLAVFDDGSGPALFASRSNGIQKWDGSAWSPVSGISEGVHTLRVFDDGSGAALFAGGRFTSVVGSTAKYIARWDGASWSALGTGIGGSWVDTLEVFDDGSGPALFAGGAFSTAGGLSASNVAKWDGVSWSALGTGVSDRLLDFAVFDDGTGPALYAAGQFLSAGGLQVNRIAKWEGSAWSALGSGVNSYVQALAVYDDGSGPALYAGGGFTTAGGVSANRIAKWDGTTWSALGSPTNGMNNTVAVLAVYDDGGGPALFAGGNFQTAGAVGAARIAKWRCDCSCSGTLPAGEWHMVSLPCAASAPTVSSVFGDDLAPGDYGSRWIVYDRSELTNSYIALKIGSLLAQGTGYWIKSLDETTLDVAGNPSPTTCPAASRYSSCFDISLTGSLAGVQNLAGHPFSSLVDWADVRFVDGTGLEYTPDEAQVAGMAAKTMYTWNGAAYEPYDGETPGMEGSLGQWNGIWVKAYENTTLRVPTATAVARGETLVPALSADPVALQSKALDSPQAGRLAAASGKGADKGGGKGGGGPLTGWYVRLTASSGTLSDPGNVLGQLSDAVDGLDDHDLGELPPFSTPYLTVVFPHPEWGGALPQYASDYHELVKGYAGTWRFEVRSDDPAREVTLTLDGPGYIFKRATLVDELTGQRIALQKNRSYQFVMNGNAHAFRFVVGP